MAEKSNSDNRKSDKSKSGKRKPGTPLLEWVTAGLGMIAALGLLGIMIWQAAVGSEDDLPNLVVEAGRLEVAPASYTLGFVVHNRSDRTASAVQVEGKLTRAGLEVETSTATLDYVPARSQARGGFQFTSDPRAGALELRAIAFQLP